MGIRMPPAMRHRVQATSLIYKGQKTVGEINKNVIKSLREGKAYPVYSDIIVVSGARKVFSSAVRHIIPLLRTL